MPATWAGWKYSTVDGSGNQTGLIGSNIDITSLAVIRAGNGYGVDGDGDGKADPWNITDAIFSAANYLSKNGLSKNPRKAILHYNKSSQYVQEVLTNYNLFKQADEEAQAALTPNLNPDFSHVGDGSGFVNPLGNAKYVFSSPYGYRIHPVTGIRKLHKGVDLATPIGTPFYAVKEGKIIHAGAINGYGYAVIIDHGNGMTSLYGHIKQGGWVVHVGELVKQGQYLGETGNTGVTSGPHLHFEIGLNGTAVDPEKYFKFR